MRKFLILSLFAAAVTLGIVAETEARCRSGRGGLLSRVLHRHGGGGGHGGQASGGCSNGSCR